MSDKVRNSFIQLATEGIINSGNEDLCLLNIVKNLLQNENFDINKQDKNGKTLLHHIVGLTSIDAANYLFENASNVAINLQDTNGQTALIYACMFKSKEMVTILLMNQADAEIKDNIGGQGRDYYENNDEFDEIISEIARGRVKNAHKNAHTK